MSSPTHCKWQVWGPHQRPGDCLQSPSTNSWDVEEAMLSAWSPLGERLKGEGEKESWQEKEVSHTVRPPCPGLECSVAPRKWRSVPPVRNQVGAAARDAHRGLASATSLLRRLLVLFATGAYPWPSAARIRFPVVPWQLKKPALMAMPESLWWPTERAVLPWR